MTNLTGRGAIVTGGFSGMGFAIATALAQAGANVAVGSYVAPPRTDGADAAYYPGADEIAHVRSALAKNGTRVYAAHLDVRDSALTDRFVAEAQAAIGPADILVNAAGTTAEQPVCGHSDELWNKIVDTGSSQGAFRATRAVLPAMIGRGWGRIINIGSTAASSAGKATLPIAPRRPGCLG